MTVKTYDPAKVNVTFGASQITGFAEDSQVNIEEIGDGITSTSGADGEVARAMSSDRRCRVTLTLQQTSRSNDVLSGYNEADRLSGGGGALPMTVRDLRGTTLFTAVAWVVKKPASGFGNAVGTREWVLETGPAAYFVGGND
ncbi:phage structural protein [Bordetella petrii]|uniref:DUF3277 domain-containing protein n=1 Tax=Bordetella petrii (strain ATCC BAA-461 / DSM 12804 / CCUG 43448 / CIP 107267 / Se-1111R) TaxID=340100 RepID=A9I927_BORPD|nr:phage protein [Bordetella petrii]CAP41320.1 conserved hypothetical protein [Bordetella petrii]